MDLAELARERIARQGERKEEPVEEEPVEEEPIRAPDPQFEDQLIGPECPGCFEPFQLTAESWKCERCDGCYCGVCLNKISERFENTATVSAIQCPVCRTLIDHERVREAQDHVRRAVGGDRDDEADDEPVARVSPAQALHNRRRSNPVLAPLMDAHDELNDSLEELADQEYKEELEAVMSYEEWTESEIINPMNKMTLKRYEVDIPSPVTAEWMRAVQQYSGMFTDAQLFEWKRVADRKGKLTKVQRTRLKKVLEQHEHGEHDLGVLYAEKRATFDYSSLALLVKKLLIGQNARRMDEVGDFLTTVFNTKVKKRDQQALIELFWVPGDRDLDQHTMRVMRLLKPYYDKGRR
jgi:hypothetical protein